MLKDPCFHLKPFIGKVLTSADPEVKKQKLNAELASRPEPDVLCMELCPQKWGVKPCLILLALPGIERTPLKIDIWNIKITQLKGKSSSKSPILGSMLIFRGVKKDNEGIMSYIWKMHPEWHHFGREPNIESSRSSSCSSLSRTNMVVIVWWQWKSTSNYIGKRQSHTMHWTKAYISNYTSYVNRVDNMYFTRHELHITWTPCICFFLQIAMITPNTGLKRYKSVEVL